MLSGRQPLGMLAESLALAFGVGMAETLRRLRHDT